MRRRLRLLAGAALPLVALVGGRMNASAATHRAALVIEHSNGSLIERCVAFAEEAISGLQLIQRSGVEYQAQTFGDLGAAVCQLDLEPAQVPANCFGSGRSWQYYRETSSGWSPSSSGAGGSTVHDGDVDGWHYAAGPQPPPGIAFSQVCGAPAPAATPGRTALAPAAAGSAPPAAARPITARAPPLQAPDPVLAHAPMRTPALLSDRLRSGSAAARSPTDQAAVAAFAAGAALLGIALLMGWRRRTP